MNIGQFVDLSQGKWRSMRSGHSLAFQYFEEVLSEVSIEKLSEEDHSVQELLTSLDKPEGIVTSPFKMEWEAESDWEPDDPTAVSAGSCILVPLQLSETKGLIVRSVGYAEAEQATSEYELSSDGTLLLSTIYGQSIAEERIWFASENVRCRSSVVKTSEGSGILQASFASEVRRLTQ